MNDSPIFTGFFSDAELERHAIETGKKFAKEIAMHYRNGREAKNGDKVVQLGHDGKIVSVGVLHDATPGNDYYNGSIAPTCTNVAGACMCDCLHMDDVAEMLKGKGLHERPSGK